MIGALVTSLVLGTHLALPVRVDGDGYLRFVREGRIVYATSATLTVEEGVLVGKPGIPLTPSVRVPAGTVKLEVDLSGNIQAVVGGGRTACGRLVLAVFDRRPTEDDGFLVSSVRARLVSPGDAGIGVIRSGSAQVLTALPIGTSASISIPAISEVSADTVTLKDIATISADSKTRGALEAIEIGPAPAPGIDFAITASRVKSLAKRAGVDADVQVPANAIIRRKAQAIKEADFVAAAVKAAQEKLGAEIPMQSNDQQPDFKAPLGAVELKAENVTISGSAISVIVGVYIDGSTRHVNTRTVNLKVDGSCELKAGAAVKIVMKSAGLTVELPGKVRTGGLIGQSVTVVTDTGTVLSGTVIGPDRVEVKM